VTPFTKQAVLQEFSAYWPLGCLLSGIQAFRWRTVRLGVGYDTMGTERIGRPELVGESRHAPQEYPAATVSAGIASNARAARRPHRARGEPRRNTRGGLQRISRQPGAGAFPGGCRRRADHVVPHSSASVDQVTVVVAGAPPLTVEQALAASSFASTHPGFLAMARVGTTDAIRVSDHTDLAGFWTTEG
jgi:hypothetical protein